MRYAPLIVILCLSSLPGIALAAVTINEVAWMGDAVSANHEWIELYNDSQTAVSVDGWTLSDGMNLAITLVGTISPLSYAVLERTSEDSAPGAAFLLYTGALVNSGATLRLVDSNGALQDQVAGGENWQGIGGDNVSKETAQYTTNGWQSAVPTPGKANTTETTIVPSNNPPSTTGSGNNKTATTLSTKPKVTKLGENKKEAELTMTVKTLAYVNERIDFSAAAKRSDATTINSLKYIWNFGDLNSDTGAKVKHLYQYPGTYVVTLKTRYAGQDELVRQEITILPVTMSLARNEAGDIQIQNNAPYEMDISGYQLSGTRSLTIPDDTIILPRGTITIPRAKLEDPSLRSLIVLYDTTRQGVAYNKPAGVAATFGLGTKRAEELRSNSSARKPVATLNSTPLSYAKTAQTATNQTLLNPPTSEPTLTKPITPQTTEPPVESENKNWPYFALIGLIALGLIIVWRSPTPKKQATIFD